MGLAHCESQYPGAVDHVTCCGNAGDVFPVGKQPSLNSPAMRP